MERLKAALDHSAGCAIGAAVWEPSEDAGELMRRADRALYRDKAVTELVRA